MPGDRGRPTSGGRSPDRGRPGAIGIRRVGGEEFELVHPRCVEERRPDYEEGVEIWKAGEPDEARDALRYALEGCGDNLWVHVALGRIALEEFRDPSLARGHFGYAFELVRRALPPAWRGRLPRRLPANRPLYDAIDGLIACHEALGEPQLAGELRRLAADWAGDADGGR